VEILPVERRDSRGCDLARDGFEGLVMPLRGIPGYGSSPLRRCTGR